MDKRNTIQRAVILDAVRKLHCHATAEEVYDYIHGGYPSISRGTVYRNLGKLADENEIRKVKLAVGPDRFDDRLTRHYHLQCTKCGRISDVEVKKDISADDFDTETDGGIISDFDIIFRGICKDCQRTEN